MSSDFEADAEILDSVVSRQPQNEQCKTDLTKSTPEASDHDTGDTRRKRRTRKSSQGHAPVKRRRTRYNDDYRKLFNTVVADVTDAGASVDKSRSLYESQVGLSKWTSMEKERFFSALTRLGKDNVRLIARAVGTKSASEVTQYLRLLRADYRQRSQESSSQDLMTMADMPAADEVTEECCVALEVAADDLMSMQESVEVSEERLKWGDAWVINYDSIRSPAEVGDQNGDLHQGAAIFPAVTLFNTENWIALSSRIFMNPSSPRAEENWQTMIQPGEEIGIRATALEDFYNVTINLMRRVIATTIFCAMSRLRSQDTRETAPSPAIKRADVVAAVKTLGLELNGQRFWIECARRCNLSVYRGTSDGISGEQPMAYSEVETLLREDGRLPLRNDMTGSREKGEKSSCQDSVEDVMQTSSNNHGDIEGDGELVGVDDRQSIEQATTFQPVMPLHDNTEMNANIRGSVVGSPEDAELDSVQSATTLDDSDSERETDIIDLGRSRIEEHLLWRILGKTPPRSTEPNNVENAHRHNPTQKRINVNAEQWRDNLSFRSEWENRGTVLSRFPGKTLPK